MTNGSVNRRGGLRWIDFKTIKVALPSKAEQLQIIELLTLIDHEIVLLKKLKQATEKQKRGVMERLLTGEVTIPDHVIERLNAEMEQDERKRIKAETRAKSKATGNYQ
jgi:restriction endonuclease S subunit